MLLQLMTQPPRVPARRSQRVDPQPTASLAQTQHCETGAQASLGLSRSNTGVGSAGRIPFRSSGARTVRFLRNRVRATRGLRVLGSTPIQSFNELQQLPQAREAEPGITAQLLALGCPIGVGPLPGQFH